MTTPIARFIHQATIATSRAVLLTIDVIAAPFLYAQEASQHAADDEHNFTATLVRQVRDATRDSSTSITPLQPVTGRSWAALPARTTGPWVSTTSTELC
jgi:hypothetical protein